MSKLFDTYIKSSQFDSLFSNDLQFVYKLQTCTTECVSSVIETVSYYIDHLGDASMYMLDALKAFDRVNLLRLFSKLLQRDMCLLFLRFLMSTYCNQQMPVKMEWYDIQYCFYFQWRTARRSSFLNPV